MSTDVRTVEVHPGKEAVVDFDIGLTFECVEECTWCCHHGVLLYEPDFLELANVADLSEATTQFRGHDFVRKPPKSRDEHDWKSARCSVFPLEVTVEPSDVTGRTGDDIHGSVREEAHEHCDGLGVPERRVIDHLDGFLPAVLWDLEDPETKREL